MSSQKTYYIKTYGCQANIADSNKIAGILEVLGYEPFNISDKSFKNEKEEFKYVLPAVDIFVINTCSVRQKSDDKVYGLGKTLKEISEATKKKPLIILSGCVVGSATSERPRADFGLLKKKTPWVDIYMNPSQISQLPQLLNNIVENTAIDDIEDIAPKYPDLNQAFVNISYGCDNFCTYCTVPYSRGREVHRSRGEIMTELDNITKKGIKKVLLCGQNVNSWGLSMDDKFTIRSGSDQKLPFAQLLRDIHDHYDFEEIGFISSNPFDFTQDLIDIFNLPRISNYLHIAVQSGNNDILKKMNRRHTREEFLELLNKIRKVRPNIEIGTDAIVGFPSETREQFLDTANLFELAKFNVAFISMYSPRKGTNAEKFYNNDVSLEEKKWRHAYLSKVLAENKGVVHE